MRRFAPALLLLLAVVARADGGYVRIPAGEYKSVIRYEDGNGKRQVPAFAMMKRPVTNGEFLAFVRRHPEWRRDRVPSIFAERGHYLAHWSAPLQPGATALPQQAVTEVSWFAATAFCEAQNARLPTWAEWEYTSAADATRRDARADPQWREAILGWYARPANAPMSPVGKSPANVYGVQDLHGLIWEWTQDYAAMLVSGDNRTQSDPDLAKFCGAGALSMDDRENYAVLMRVAMLSSLEAVNSTSSLGFRCARDLP
ncbi:MAG TPA: formylglycine-generating enzyme family protein [Arenimonas sp.]|uniref:formylglycine-generating enzyme family protein n=1 Tax=Arenimonas sp. TaxID=1872635 RepID=UPI002BE46713|nr:formylglycine-generating enzyme family protein [Arenimonas sp.]HMB55934.1 formylglycine-generating enzyme family protein [Arenimonas sp.]